MSIRDYQLYIDGQFTDGVSGQRFVSCNPSDGTEVASFAGASEGDAEAAFDSLWPCCAEQARTNRAMPMIGRNHLDDDEINDPSVRSDTRCFD